MYFDQFISHLIYGYFYSFQFLKSFQVEHLYSGKNVKKYFIFLQVDILLDQAKDKHILGITYAGWEPWA